VQELERIKAEMAAIQRNPDLSQDEKKNRGEVKMRELYSASGRAKISGAVKQVERALEEGELSLASAILVNLCIDTCVQRLWDCINQLHQQKQLATVMLIVLGWSCKESMQ